MVNVNQILKFLNDSGIEYSYEGSCNVIVEGFSSLNNYKQNTITWNKNDSVSDDIIPIVTLCIVQDGCDRLPENSIICQESKRAFFSILDYFWGNKEIIYSSIGQHTYIDSNVQIGTNVRIGNGCSISGKVVIGDNTVISDSVVIKGNVIIGKNCTIQALVVIGEDGFGYSEDDNHIKSMIKHYGGVTIGNDVFIGSHTNIARGVIDDTIIGNGVKIAPSTHIGHNNIIGNNVTIICSQLYGSVYTGDNSYIVGSIVKNQSVIGNNVVVGMGSTVVKNIPDDKVAFGSPAQIVRDNIVN